MRRSLALFSITLLFVVGSAAFPVAQPQSQALDRVIVVFQDGVADPAAAARELAQRHGAQLGFVYQDALKGFSAEVPSSRLAALARDPRVAFVELDQVAHTFAQELPTGIDRIELDLLEPGVVDDGTTITIDVDIAILDTGIDVNHPDLNLYKRTNCARRGPMNTTCADGEGNDGHGHGTHVAGTAAAIDNGQGVVGVAPGARLWAVKVLGDDGSGWISWIVAGVDWVTKHADSIEVANMSLGCECSSSALDNAIANSVAKGVVYVVAAGNSNKDASTFSPANHPDVITVSAVADFDGKAGGAGEPTCRTDTDDTLANFSNHGEKVDIAAPGVCILSTWKDGGYHTISGTSMASPHAAGAAALYMALNGVTSSSKDGVYAIRDALVGAALPQGTTNHPCSYDDSRVGGPLLFVNAAAFGGNGSCEVAGGGLAVSNLVVNPDPFSPNADGVKDATTISFDLNGAADWTVDIGDGSGTTVKAFSGTATEATKVEVSWDGTDSDGNPVGDGTYTVDVTATTTEETASASTTVTVDTTAPTISSGPSAENVDHDSADIVWGTDEASDSLVEYRKDGETSYSSVYDSSLVTGHSVSLTSLASETTYYYRVTSTDAAGNAVTSAEGSFTTAVAPAAGENDMYVADIEPSTSKSGIWTNVTTTVTIRRASDNGPVGSASVRFVLTAERPCASGTISSWTFTDTTNSNGQASFTLKTTAPDGCWTGEVTELTHGTYTWNKSLDHNNPRYWEISGGTIQ